MTPCALVSRPHDLVVLIAGLGPTEFFIIFFVLLTTLAVPGLVLWLVFAAGRRKGAADAAKSYRPAD